MENDQGEDLVIRKYPNLFIIEYGFLWKYKQKWDIFELTEQEKVDKVQYVDNQKKY